MKPPARMSTVAAHSVAERAAQTLAKDARVQLVLLFGSATDPGRESVRDVDLAALFDRPLPVDELMKLRADAGVAAGGTIDLVSLNGASVVLAWEVADTGRCLYARTPEVETEFITRARARYWDFKPFLEEQWRLAGERLRERPGGAST